MDPLFFEVLSGDTIISFHCYYLVEKLIITKYNTLIYYEMQKTA